jgi:RND superfamily putative drug exporter
MDYQVFLISRIREEWRTGQSDSEAVAHGLAATGRIITSTAAIMIWVFAAFVLRDLRVLRVVGLGMAVAILLDAILVRMVLMPSLLQLMRPVNWWFPRMLERAVPSFLAEIQAPPPAGAGPARSDVGLVTLLPPLENQPGLSGPLRMKGRR